MAKKACNKGSLGFDYHNLTPEQKQKVSSVCEQFPEIAKEGIAILMHYNDYDSDKAVNSLTLDGGALAYKYWNAAQSNQTKVNKNKKRNKKKNKKEDGPSSSAVTLCNDADDSSSLHSSNVDFEGERESNAKFDDCDDANDRTEQEPSSICSNLVSNPTCDELSLSDTLVENEVSESPVRMATDPEDAADLLMEANVDSLSSAKCDSLECENSEKASVTSGSPREKGDEQSRCPSQKQFNRQRHGSSHHSKSSFSEDNSASQALNAQKRGGFSKCKKDLLRQTVSLQRIQQQLENHLDDSYKNMKNSISEIRKMLDERQLKLEQDMEKVKEEALSLLKGRQDLASDLKRRCDRAQSLNESEWNDLRADIKQFVTERKYDDDLGKTIWFHWSIDTITDELAKFGEVCPVKNVYSQRQLSRLTNTPEPNVSHSAAGEDETALTGLNTDYESALGSDGNNEVEEAKPEKDVPIKSAVQGESRPRVFSNKRYSQFGGRYPPNHNNRGQGFYRGRGHVGGYGHRGRNYENYRQFGGERNNDYRPFSNYHNRAEFSHATDDKSGEAAQNVNENNTARYSMPPRENQGHFRGHDRRPYGGYRPRPFNFNRGRAANRAARPNPEPTPTGTETATDKNANYDNEVSQENKGMLNGY